jgi:hypothetical protein
MNGFALLTLAHCALNTEEGTRDERREKFCKLYNGTFCSAFFARKAIQRQAKFIPPFRQKATRHNNIVLSFRVERCDGGKISVVFLVTLVSAQRLNSRWKLQSREMDNGELRWMLIQQFACWHRHWSAARDEVSSARDSPLLSIH